MCGLNGHIDHRICVGSMMLERQVRVRHQGAVTSHQNNTLLVKRYLKLLILKYTLWNVTFRFRTSANNNLNTINMYFARYKIQHLK